METSQEFGSPDVADDVKALERVAEDLRRELEGLRTALRHRAVIEQAKGVLTAVTGDDPDEAFRRLVQRSQSTNQRLTQLAAGVVAQAIRMPPGSRPDGSRLFDEPEKGAREHQLVGAALSSVTGDVAGLARTVLAELSDVGVSTVVLTAMQSDESLTLLAYEGPDRALAAGWERIPLSSDVPLADAALSGHDVLLGDRLARFERFPGSRKLRGALDASASLRLLVGHRCVGVLGLGWSGAVEFDDALYRRLRSVATKLAPHLARHARDPHGNDLGDPGAESGYDHAFRDFVRLVDQPVAFLEPIIEGEVLIDLRLEHANGHAEVDLGIPPGRTLLTVYPALATGGFLARTRQVLATGRPSVDVAPPGAGAEASDRLAAARLGRLGSLVAAAWEPESPSAMSGHSD